ncbi:6-hydroxymethylpterin diphosphokinase MptE-like protein [Spirochaeta isovalerica]|uniref:6-hydroxymethylpterin diphosphokinase MptE-like domain-containing protein n=1 Tax=Spirochaeta isovalerica TaxID=150 RepID=A0A841R525_9SPIO|nr:6-hydroxymethylpterin diphosphokinase MptE-like protein [Spirochaeta isovalerica]MBB6478903.1 hypothetical protein [Spirochaeta isovalerica]
MRFYRSDKGFQCAELGGKNIHSRYNPRKEAERFIDKTVTDMPETIVLIGAGLGYLQNYLKTKFPQARIICIFLDDEIYKNSFSEKNDFLCWFPGSPDSISQFFFKNIHEDRLSSLSVIEWEPCAQLFPGLSLEISKALKTTIQELNGNILTTAWFGKKWLRNLIVNYISMDYYLSPVTIEKPILIASSGPTLSEIIDDLSVFRNRFFLIALPSSLAAFSKAGITPDLLISTDPGYYSSVHLYYLGLNVPLAQPLTAGRGFWRKNASIMVLNQETPFEKDLFSITGLEHQAVKPNGTVSGTALQFSGLYNNPVYFAGLDLCFRDIQSHTKPHSFDVLLFDRTLRNNPLHSIYFNRASGAVPDFSRGIRTGRSLDTYRNWFEKYIRSNNADVYRINPSPVSIEGFKNCRVEDIPDKDYHNSLTSQISETSPVETRKKQINKLLAKWIQEQENGENSSFFYFLDAVNATGSKNRTDAIKYLNKLKVIYE